MDNETWRMFVVLLLSAIAALLLMIRRQDISVFKAEMSALDSRVKKTERQHLLLVLGVAHILRKIDPAQADLIHEIEKVTLEADDPDRLVKRFS
ncbi:MAG: hypothetical protein WB780_20300 [Candidatus Acidiferrales bacterium]